MPGPATPPFPQRLTLALPNFDNGTIAELIAGEEKASFSVHRLLLDSSAPFFFAALESTFKEGNEQRILLPEEHPTTVQCFVQWIYYKSYNLPEGNDERFLQLARLYIFADKFLVQRLKEDVIRTLFYLRSQNATAPQLPVVLFAFEHMPQQSPIRKLLVDWYVWHVDLGWFAEGSTLESLVQNPEFAAEVTCRFALRLKSNQTSPLLGIPDTYFEPPAKPLPITKPFVRRGGLS